jgi:transcriptional regulator with XRE-family HTH domain
MQIGHKIKKMRELRNFTQAHVAEKLEINQASYSRIEANETDVSFSKLCKIAEILEVPLTHLIDFNEKSILYINTQNHANNGFVFADSNQEILSLKENYEARLADKEQEISYLRGLVEKMLK